jgi:hypothetical protein
MNGDHPVFVPGWHQAQEASNAGARTHVERLQ